MAAARHVRPGRSTAAGLQLERIDSCACRPGVVFRLRIVPHAPRQAAPRNGFRDWSESLTVRLLVLAGSFVPLCCWNVSGWALLANRDFPIPRTRWAFYIYYVGHLALLAVLARTMAVHAA